MNDKKVAISMNLINAVMSYLGKQQYESVYQLIQAIQSEVVPQISEQKPASSESAQAPAVAE